jgi:predicted SAM-dependent methyltransferase
MKLLNLGCGKSFHPDWVNVDFHSTEPGVISHNLNQGIPFEDNSFDVVYHSHLLEHFPKSHAPVFLKECYRVLRISGTIRVAVPDLEQIVRWYLKLFEQSLNGNEEAQKKYEWIMIELFDQMVRNCSGGEMLKYWSREYIPAEDFVIERVGSEAKNSISQIIKLKSEWKMNDSCTNADNENTNPLSIGAFRLSGEVHQWMYDRYSLGKLLDQAGFQNIKVCRANESRIPDFHSYLLDIEADGSVRKPDSLFMEARKP